MAKQFDVIVFGATGFTGALVARYLLQEPETALGATGGLKWALAARSASKLASVKDELKTKVPSVAPEAIDAIPTVIANSGDEASLVAMVRQTKVVLSIVGPYKLYGSLLVKACAENGVHYCDLTGEVLWIDEMVAKYEAAARESGAILVNCCGFESIPSDITTFLLADDIKQKHGSDTSEIDLYFTKLKGEASGGTLASVFAVIETSSSKDLARSRHPFLLTDERTRADKEVQGLVKPNATSAKITYDNVLKKWSSLFIGGSVNQAIVHRSNYLLQGLYGKNFVYRERQVVGGYWKNLFATVGVALLGIALYFRWTRALIKRIAPSPGQGPSEEVMKNGFFVAESVGYNADSKAVVKAKTVGSGDPGYSLTSKLISECAICLAKDEFGRTKLPGGFYTPASAFGHKIAKRLDSKKYITFQLEAL
uniref:Saccharopine dehydrogenase NADP binding domain-containing protein n=1 Tax=Globisporangium ultimum (strain ATCC 200006 / CBS 805.95 / DAOM BR144) TaxID=431595 RepID=K3XAR7_GLOUD